MPSSLESLTPRWLLRLECRAERALAILWLLASTRGYEAIKRALDITAASLLLLLSAPLFLAIAIAIKLEDRGPVLYWQQRVGRHGSILPFPKFRSMRMDADKMREQLLANSHHTDSVTFKMKRDPRVTFVGRFLRRYSLDELPQLWCVLANHMSLVGPRPPLPSEVQYYRLADRRRLDVRPGLTCIWQVSGRADIPFLRQVLLDVEYIESQCLQLDLRLLLATVPAVLKGRGAY